jgi:hypothetical protein
MLRGAVRDVRAAARIGILGREPRLRHHPA